MPIIGFNFDKIEAENKHTKSQKIGIQPNIDFKGVEKKIMMVGSEKKDTLKFSFEYSIEYKENIGYIKFQGHVLYLGTKEENNTIMNQWKKEKKLPKLLTAQILNLILLRSNIKALNISQDINLPPHVQLPHIVPRKKTKESEYIG